MKYRTVRSVFFKFLTFFGPFVSLVYCTSNKETQAITTDGFVVIRESSDWLFFPARNLDLESCQRDFITDNLQLGIRVYPEQLADTTFSLLERSADTIILTRPIEVERGFRNFIKIVPVSLKYSIDNRFVGTVSQLRSEFGLHTKKNTISLKYDQFPLQILSMNPIFCLSKKRNNIAETECAHIREDPDGYLYKICEYLTSHDKYSTLPNHYKVRSVKMDTMNGREVLAVELTCCYLGDIAYFDPASKKIISLKFGAK